MAWIPVPGTNGAWEYENTATKVDSYIDSNGTVSSGVRSFVSPFSGVTQQSYLRTRRTGETIERGELSKNYYDHKTI